MNSLATGMLLHLSLLALAAAPLLYLFFTWNHNYWRKRGVPYEKPLVLFGSYKDVFFLKKTVGQVISDIYRRAAGKPYIGYFQFGKPVLLLRDPELIKLVLVKDFNSFHDNTFVADEKLDPLMARSPFVLTGDKWKCVRSLLTPAFTVSKIKPQFPLMATVCKELVEYLEQEAPKSRPDGIEAKELAGKFTTDVVATCAFGIRANSFKDPDAELRRMGKRILAPGFWKNIQFLLTLFSPKLASLLKIRFMPLDVADFFRRIIKEVVSYREENNDTRNDYLQMLIQIKHKGQVEDDSSPATVRVGGVDIEYTDEDITSHALSFYADGFETSSIALSFALYDLAVNPECQARLRAEVDAVLSRHQGILSHEAFQEMSYLDMVLSESLRLHSPALAMERMCTKEYQLPLPSGGWCTLEVGCAMVFPIHALHLDPEHFPEPDKFDPERFSEERKTSIKRYTYLPFGDGPRQCLGMKFAVAQIKAGLATMVSHFEVRKTPRTPIPIVQDPTYFLAAAKGGLWLDFVRRTDRC